MLLRYSVNLIKLYLSLQYSHFTPQENDCPKVNYGDNLINDNCQDVSQAEDTCKDNIKHFFKIKKDQ